MSNDILITAELTNTCTCTVYDEETGEYTDEPSTDCDGTCWEYGVEDFYNLCEEVIASNETGWWKVTNLRLWDGEHSGYFHVKPQKHRWTEASEIIRGMTVDSMWTLRYTAYPDRVEYSLSHHDAMGSASVLTPVSEEEVEELGLY